MCIVLLTTAHPRYALIVIDNRDEFILRPTSRPHWWTAAPSRQPSRTSTPQPTNGTGNTNGAAADDVQHVLSSRDLQRAERGTWLGITKSGNFAVLTNYREANTTDHPIHGTRSRGGMVTAWLGSPRDESVAHFVARMMADGGYKGVGGFSLICGKLRRHKAGTVNGNGNGNGNGNSNGTAGPQDASAGPTLEPLAILSNRNDNPESVPWIGGQRGEVHGLSNTSFDDPATWPKLETGKRLMKEAIASAVAQDDLDEAGLRDRLFAILDHDTLPVHAGMGFEEYMMTLKESIFIPAIGDAVHKAAMAEATATGKAPEWNELMLEVKGEERPDEQQMGYTTGMYGTQRQTVVLVDWDGNVTYTERALYDANGNAIGRGEGDMTFRFKIEGWDEEGQ